MTRIFACFATLLILSGCGGGSGSPSALRSSGSATMFATGPIYQACKSAGRKQASRQRCGCVQAVANQELKADDQRRGASFFKDPQKAESVRQSSSNRDERFWGKWKAYSERAVQICT